MYNYIEWCTLLCLEDNKKYVAATSGLESEDGLGIAEVDLAPGKHVVWFYRGLPYDAEILEIHGNL